MQSRFQISRSFHVIATLVVVFGTAAVSAQGLYKYVDENGKVVYSDQPPPTTAKTEKIIRRAEGPDAATIKSLADKNADFAKRQKEKSESTEKQAQANADKQRRDEWCSQAKGKLKNFQAGELMHRFDSEGNRVYLEEAERKQEMQRLEGEISKNCSA